MTRSARFTPRWSFLRIEESSMFQVNAYWFYDFGQVVRAVLEWANSPRLVDDRALKAFVDADDF
jgi:hypothetical protein